MRLPFFITMLRWAPLALILAASGCEVGNRWFSMSSDSPMPWFGVDLLPRRRTTQILPSASPENATRDVASRRHVSENRGEASTGRVWSKELHLPSIPAFFDSETDEELSFKGPTAPFAR